jgi:nitrite reductase/ring-hydroxylating ferredoxin subunit
MPETSEADVTRRDRREPYSGYYLRDVPSHDPEITHTGPGTPMGEYMRRFWQPICMSEELTDLPKAIRIMGEDLVAFRDKSGSIGVLHRHCSHRGTSLEYGIIAEHGIRCCYHGWLFDVDGRILETPGEPPESRLKDSFVHGAYPAFERDGLVFCYMGPPDEKPPFPEREAYEGATLTKAFSIPYANNWFQGYENVMDPVHSAFLHAMTGIQLVEAFAELPHVDYQETGNGSGIMYISKRRLGQDRMWVRHIQCLFPNEAHVGTLFEDGGEEVFFRRVYEARWNVPIDDENSLLIGWRFFGPHLPGGDPDLVGWNSIDFGGQAEMPDYETKQRTPGDWEAQGAIAVHRLEHLGATDAGVAMIRRLLRRAVRGEVPVAWPETSEIGRRSDPAQRPDPRYVYTQDSVLTVPRAADATGEWRLLAEVGEKVTAILLAADEFEGAERDAFVVRELNKLNGA